MERSTYQLCEVGHLSHVVQCVFSGFVQHDEAGGHGAQVPERLHVRVHVTVAVYNRRWVKIVKQEH